jgi:hypothetical protein
VTAPRDRRCRAVNAPRALPTSQHLAAAPGNRPAASETVIELD